MKKLMEYKMQGNGRNVDLGDVPKAVYENKLLVIIVTILFGIISIVVALSIPNQFESKVLLAPNNSESNSNLGGLSSQLGGLANLAGLSIDSQNVDPAQVAIAVLKSRDFLIKFIEEKEIKVPLFAANGWNYKTDQLEIDEGVYDIEKKVWVRNVELPKKPEPSSEEVYEVIIDKLSVETLESGLLEVKFEFYSPSLAAKWLKWLIDDLNEEVRAREKKEAINSILFLQKEIRKTELAEVKTVLYQLIEEQTKKLMFAEVRDEYSFKVIDSAFIPETKSFPNRPLICILITFIGFIVSSIYSVLLFAYKNNRNVQ